MEPKTQRRLSETEKMVWKKAVQYWNGKEIVLNILTKAPYIICSSINRAELNKSRQERVMNSSDEIDRLVLKALNASWNGSTEE